MNNEDFTLKDASKIVHKKIRECALRKISPALRKLHMTKCEIEETISSLRDDFKITESEFISILQTGE